MVLARDLQLGEKQCTLCKETKPLASFYFFKNVSRYHSRCRPCAKLHGRVEYTRVGTIRAASNIRANKAYYQRNKEKLREKSKAWYWKNRDKCIERRKQWSRDNFEKRPAIKAAMREHSKRHHLKRSYGITVDERDALFAKNNGLCWICNKNTSDCVDHDHDTGKIRGALCRKCNAGLGLFGENNETLLSAALYLKSGRTF